MSNTPRVLLFAGKSASSCDALVGRLRPRGLVSLRMDLAGAEPDVDLKRDDLAVVVLDPAEGTDQAQPLAALLDRLASGNVPTVVWNAGDGVRRDGGPFVEWLSPEVSLEELVGKIGTLTRYAPLMKGMERELQQLQHLGQQLNHYFGEIDQEMRLAGRLQRDFMPRELPQVPGFAFEAIFRPASWVSGDLYDAFCIDEHHLGMFIADAMGHGVAAGLLTMFLRHALPSRQIDGQSHRLVGPAEALGDLHASLVRQHLPNCQFVTAAYAIIDTRSRELTLARAGHPYPILISRNGEISEVRVNGSLLGLGDIASDFSERRITLAPGDKLVFYTDGADDMFLLTDGSGVDNVSPTPQMQQWARLSAGDFTGAAGEHLDCQEGSLHPADDVTVLVLEVGSG